MASKKKEPKVKFLANIEVKSFHTVPLKGTTWAEAAAEASSLDYDCLKVKPTIEWSDTVVSGVYMETGE